MVISEGYFDQEGVLNSVGSGQSRRSLVPGDISVQSPGLSMF